MTARTRGNDSGPRKRRDRGEGTVRKRADGRWEARVDLGWTGGGRRQVSFYGRTKAGVLDKLHRAQRVVDAGGALPDEQLRVGRFLEQWLEKVVRPNRELATWQGYETNVRLHITPAIGHVRLARLKPSDVQALLNAKRADGLAPRTVQYIHATLRAALNVALRWGLISRNVATLVEPVAVVREQVRPFTPEEAKLVLATAASHRLRTLFTVAMAMGLRPSEALGLAWDDVDLDGGVLHVRHALERFETRGEYRLKEPKSRRSRRTIPLPAVCAEALGQHRRDQAQERLAADEAWHDCGLVFTTPLGGPLDRRDVSRQFSKLLRDNGLPHRRLYDCRHTAASLLLAQGVSPRVIMEILGHTSFALTMETYTHVIPQMMRDSADAMDRALRPRRRRPGSAPT